MQNKLHLNSVAVGLAIGAIAALSIGAAVTPNTPTGRYKLAIFEPANSAYTPEVLKIDTVTGQVWMSSPGSKGWAAFLEGTGD